MINLFSIIGALGIIFISAGVLKKGKRKESWLYIAGGICMSLYSIYIMDPLFIILQIIFIAAAVYELLKSYRKI